jgi:hypothetical protein
MKVLIGVDPHKASVAVAVVDEVGSELVQRASFPQNRAGLRALERFKRTGSPSAARAVENAGGLGVGTWRGDWRDGRRIRGGRAAEAFGEGSGAL